MYIFILAQNRTLEIYVGEESGWRSQTKCGRQTLIRPKTTLTISCNHERPVRYLTVKDDSYVAIALCEVVVNGHQYQGEC